MLYQRSKEIQGSAWKRTLYIMLIAESMAMVGFSSIYPFLPLYVNELGARSSIPIEFFAGLVFSAQAFAMMISAPIWGAIADRFGRKLMVERAMFSGAVIMLLMAFVHSAEELVILRIFQGLMTGTMAAANALVASAAPRERSGYAMGLMQMGCGVGLATGPLIGGVIADRLGYSAAFYVTAGMIFVAGLMVMTGVREEFKPKESVDAGVIKFLAEWRRILSAPGVTIIYSMRFLSAMGRMMIVPIMPLFILTLLTKGAGVNTFTGLIVGIASAATTVSAIALGNLGDRIGHRRIVIISILMGALFYLPQGWVSAGWQLLILQALVGVAMGGITPGLSALLTNYTRSGEEGAAFGLDNSVTSAGKTVAPLLGSAVALWFGLRSTFAVTALLFLLAGLLAAWLLPNNRIKNSDSSLVN